MVTPDFLSSGVMASELGVDFLLSVAVAWIISEFDAQFCLLDLLKQRTKTNQDSAVP